jgi:nitronate monooxygenase
VLADEAGSSPVHRAALQDPQFAETVVTRCFSGRYARGLRNRFIDDHDGAAPFGYPEIHHMTSPLRAAAVRAGDPHGTNVWAGTGFRKARTGSVADIMSALA